MTTSDLIDLLILSFWVVWLAVQSRPRNEAKGRTFRRATMVFLDMNKPAEEPHA
jgi:hypothetical protein